MGHSLGPFTANELPLRVEHRPLRSADVIVTADGKEVAAVYFEGDGRGQVAPMFASAPRMLELLREVRLAISYGLTPPRVPDIIALLDELKKAGA